MESQPFYNPKNWQNIQEPIQQAFDEIFKKVHVLEAKVDDLTTENVILKKQLLNFQNTYATTKYVNNFTIETTRKEINQAFKRQEAAYEEDAEITEFLTSNGSVPKVSSSISSAENNNTISTSAITNNGNNQSWLFMQTGIEKINHELALVREELAQKASKRSVVAAIRQKSTEIIAKQDEFYETLSAILREKADVVTVNNALSKKADATKIADVMTALERRIQKDTDARITRISSQVSSSLLMGANIDNASKKGFAINVDGENNVVEALVRSDLMHLRDDAYNFNIKTNERIDELRQDVIKIKDTFNDMFGSDSTIYLNSTTDSNGIQTFGVTQTTREEGSFVKVLTNEILTKARRNAAEQLDGVKTYFKQELAAANSRIDNCEIDIRAGDNRVESSLKGTIDKNITLLKDKMEKQNNELSTITRANTVAITELSASTHMVKKMFNNNMLGKENTDNVYICDDALNVENVTSPISRVIRELATVNKKLLTLAETVARKADKAETDILREKIALAFPSAKYMASMAQKPSITQVKEMINQSAYEIKKWIDECASIEEN